MRLPEIGKWQKTSESTPPAGCTILGLYFLNGTPSVSFLAALYIDRSGQAVDPSESRWKSIVFRSRQGHEADSWDDEMGAPDYWAECRFLTEAP